MKKKRYIGVLLCTTVLCLMCAVTPTLRAAALRNDQADYLWPIPDRHHITSFFGKRTIALYGRERAHTGIDINAAMNSPVIAIDGGTVIVSVYDGGWGEYIMINHGSNRISLYAHLNTRSVKRGDTVEAGQQIGTSGNSGLSEAPHLHFELREHGKAINPFRYTYRDESVS